MSVMRTRGHGGDNGEPLGVNHQIRVIDVRVVNKQWAEHPSPGGLRAYKNDLNILLHKSVAGNGNLELNG